MDDSVITCDEIIESYDGNGEANSYDETNFNEKKTKSQKRKISISYLHFH